MTLQLLRHPQLNTIAKRMGKVIRATMKTEAQGVPKILADTSAWITGFYRKGHEALKQKLKEALEKNLRPEALWN